MHAEYDRESDDYNAHRVVQAFDTAQFIQTTRGDSVMQVLAGDLNTEPGDLAHRMLLAASQLQETHSEVQHGEMGTNECAHNTYTRPSVKQKFPNGKRIDYILYRNGLNTDVKVIDYALPLPEFIPEQKVSYSDHEAVYAKLSVSERSNTNEIYHDEGTCASIAKINGVDYEATLNEGIRVCDEILRRLQSDRRIYFIMAFTIFIGLLYMIDFHPSYGWKLAFVILKTIISGLALFFVFMATMWNAIERNGILSSKLSMEMALQAAHIELKPQKQTCF